MKDELLLTKKVLIECILESFLKKEDFEVTKNCILYILLNNSLSIDEFNKIFD